MYQYYPIILGLGLVFFNCHCSGQQYHDGFTHKADFGAPAVLRDVSVFWTPGEKDSDWIQFEIRAKTKGWMGLGFSPTGAMKGADIVVMWIDKDGKPQISDRHGPSDQPNGYPPEDPQQDYEILWANETDTHTTFQIRRRMATCDENDWKISMGTVHLLFAYNDQKLVNGELTKHDDKFSRSVRLIGPDDRERVQNVFHSPDIFTTVDFPAGGVHIPGDSDTLYWCRIFRLPKFDRPLQIVGHEMLVQSGNEAFVHHMLLYSCHGDMSAYMDSPESCYDGPQQFMNNCSTGIYGGWAVGGEPFAYSNDMGVQYVGEEYDYFSAEFHYDNSQYAKNLTDNSTFRIYLTDKLRPIKVGKLSLGSSSNALAMERFKHYTYCPSSCTNNLENDTLTFMSGFLHSHLAGRAIRVRHLRNGVELEPIIEDNNYDFNYQSTIIFKERKFFAGDELIVECEYSSMDRNATGGLSTHHEMCVAFLDYYPRHRFMEQECMSEFDPEQLPLVLGAQRADGLQDPATTTIIDAQGRNRSYNEWLSNLDWQANDSELIKKLQKFVKEAPQYSICKIANSTSIVDDAIYYRMEANPKIDHPYVAPNDFCEPDGSTTPEGGNGRSTTAEGGNGGLTTPEGGNGRSTTPAGGNGGSTTSAGGNGRSMIFAGKSVTISFVCIIMLFLKSLIL